MNWKKDNAIQRLVVTMGDVMHSLHQLKIHREKMAEIPDTEDVLDIIDAFCAERDTMGQEYIKVRDMLPEPKYTTSGPQAWWTYGT